MELFVVFISYKLKPYLPGGGSRLTRLEMVIKLGDSRKSTKPIQKAQKAVRLTRPLQDSTSSKRLLKERKLNAGATKK